MQSLCIWLFFFFKFFNIFSSPDRHRLPEAINRIQFAVAERAITPRV